MNKALICTVAVTFMVSATARARIGETMEQCQARYGPEIEKIDATNPQSDPKLSVFSRSGITTTVEFRGGKAWRVLFRKAGLTREEQELLLKANMDEAGWSAALEIDGREYRLSSDKQRIAVFTPGKSASSVATLEVALREYGVANHAAYSARVLAVLGGKKESKGAKSLEGF